MRKFIPVLLLLAFLGCQQDDSTSTGGSKPAISGMTPTSVVQGQLNVDGRITGANFTGVVAVNLGPGLNVVSTEAISASEFKVVFNVATDAAPGPRTISVATAAGKATADGLLTISDNKMPIAEFNASTLKTFRNQKITFDAGPSNDPDGKITSYAWDFGDGAKAEGKTVQHSYAAPGNFQVNLTVTDDHKATSVSTKTVVVENAYPPVAHFNFTPRTGSASTQFEFDGSSSTDTDGRIIKYLWDFGDGSEVQGKLVRHKFPSSREFKVKLTVWDNDNLQDYTEKVLEVKGTPPVARFIATPREGPPGTTFRFESISNDDGTIAQFDWNFGDGSVGKGKTITHKYPNVGTYNVKLTVTDNDNLTDSDEKEIVVSNDDGGGGGGGGGGGDPDLCSGSNFKGQLFRVVDVSGLTITANVTFQVCPGKCGEIRRDEVGIREFVGDARRISGNQVTFDPGSLPLSTRPEAGESLRMIWKRCN